MTASSGIHWPTVWRRALIAAAVVAFLVLLTRIPYTVEVFILATLIAYGVNPLVHRLVRRMPRPLAIGLVYAGVVALLLIAGVIIILDSVAQLQTIFGNFGSYVASAQHVAVETQTLLNAKFGAKVLPPQLLDIEGRVGAEVATLVNVVLTSAGAFAFGVVQAVVVAITAIILSYFFLRHSAAIRESFCSLFPDRAQDQAQMFAREVGRVVGGFIYGQLVLCAFTGAFTTLVLLLTGSQYALLLGVLTGLFYAVPYLGIFVAIVAGALLGLTQSWTMALITVVTIFIVSRIADLFLVPKVMAQSVGVSPMAIIFAVFAGGELFGMWGLVLAIPAAAVFKVVWRFWLHPWITGKPPVYAL